MNRVKIRTKLIFAGYLPNMDLPVNLGWVYNDVADIQLMNKSVNLTK